MADSRAPLTHPMVQAAGSLWLCIFAASLVTWLLSGCAAVEEVLGSLDEPSAEIVGVSLDDLSLDGATLAFDVQVTNPYAVDLPLLDLDWSLTSGGASLLAGTLRPSSSLPAGQATILSVPASLRFADLLATLSGVRPGAVVPYEFDATLGVDAPVVGRMELPLRRQGEVPVPAVPEVELESVAWSQLSLQQATATLRLRLGNTNDFPVSLTRMDYALSLGGAEVAAASLAEAASIDEGGSAVLRVPISFAPADLGLAAFKMLTGSGAGYVLGGTLDVHTPFGPLSLPFDREGTTSFLHRAAG